ncbi:MAG: hypothetical protein FJW35_15700 [Acidobacteria bacterium]|nr:hypothetical protein [Acidobacteriota bacterium]
MATKEWEIRHAQAVANPGLREVGLVSLLEGWERYGEKHFVLHGSMIGADCVLGPAWETIGESLLILLNGDLGRLDGGLLDSRIRQAAQRNGATLE